MNRCTGWEDGYFLCVEKLAMTIVKKRGRGSLLLPLVKRVALRPLVEHRDYSLLDSLGVKPFLMCT